MSDTNPRNSEPVLRLSRLSADLSSAGGPTTPTPTCPSCARSSSEPWPAEQDIADRHFAGATSAPGVVTT